MAQKVIIKQKHKQGCAAVSAVDRGAWQSPWFINGDVQHLDAAGGHRSAWHRWQSFICNDPSCPAHGIVNVDWLEKLVFIGSRLAAQEARELEK